ncbi:MAG: hypothetical protein SFX73_17410 [Kofleriaceae bacterium]|nr:hypothetical protein [Kofleriaceae bacterium]
MTKSYLLGLAVVATACATDGANTTGIPDECNPLGGQGCLLPWPSATYLREDASAVTGFRVDLPAAAMPTNADNIEIDPLVFDRFDGFSLSGPLIVAFPEGVSPTGLPSFKNPDESLAPGSPVVLVAIDSGERVPLFAEVDQNVLEVTKRSLVIRPLARLKPGTRYVAVIRNGVKAADGSDLASPPGFAALRDGTSFRHPRFDAIAKRWPDIFAKLGALGIEKTDIVLAWDFVTASDELMRGDLTSMRNDALPAIGTNGANLSFTISSTEPNVTQSYKRYLGTYKAPDFLTNGEADTSLLRRGGTGLPEMNGMRDARFAAIIPSCVQTAQLPRPVIVFGHGLFGSAKEYLSDGFVLDLAETQCVVILAGDFIGLTSRQLQLAPLAVNDMNRGPQIAEKLAQSVIDFMSLGALARGKMVTAPEFQFNGSAIIDPSQVFYVGGSLGGTVGNTIMAYDPGFKKGVLAVPGGVWSMLFERSAAWFALLGAAQGSYTDPAVYQLVVAFLGLAMEPYDPISTAGHVIKDPLFADQQPKEILMWYTLGDCLITNIATEMIIREMGISVLAPSVKDVWRSPAMNPPLVNAVTIYNEHPTPMPPDTNQPPSEDNGTHSGVNRNQAAMRQVQEFLLENRITPTCKDGNDNIVACDCNPDGGGVCD